MGTIVCFLIWILIARYIYRTHLLRQLHHHLRQFELSDDGETYKVALPRSYVPSSKGKAKVGMLLLHGYSASPAEYHHLYPALEKAKIAYEAPLLSGFGLCHLRRLEHSSYFDWMRDVTAAYNRLLDHAEIIVVLGHSNGGNLGLWLTQQKKVDKLVLIGPNVVVSPEDRKIKTWLQHAQIGPVVRFLMPLFRKPFRSNRISNTDTLEPMAATHAFHFPVLPITSLEQLWELQDEMASVQSVNCPVLMMAGAHDLSINLAETREWLKQKAPAYTEWIAPNAAHNVLEDYGWQDAIEPIVDFCVQDG